MGVMVTQADSFADYSHDRDAQASRRSQIWSSTLISALLGIGYLSGLAFVVGLSGWAFFVYNGLAGPLLGWLCAYLYRPRCSFCGSPSQEALAGLPRQFGGGPGKQAIEEIPSARLFNLKNAAQTDLESIGTAFELCVCGTCKMYWEWRQYPVDSTQINHLVARIQELSKEKRRGAG